MISELEYPCNVNVLHFLNYLLNLGYCGNKLPSSGVFYEIFFFRVVLLIPIANFFNFLILLQNKNYFIFVITY